MKKFFLRSMSWLRLMRLPHLRHLARLIWRLLRDRRVPMYLKGMLGIALVYTLSPLDLIPESVALLFGLVDDLAIAVMSVNWFLRLAPREAVDEHLKSLPPKFQHSFLAWQKDQQPLERADGAG